MYNQLTGALDKAIPDDKISEGLWNILSEGDQKIELDDELIKIPNDTKIEIVTKAFFLERFESVGFGVYKILVAIGGFNRGVHGDHSAGICFSTLYYNNEARMITIDFHKEFR